MSARTILKHLHQQGRMTDYQFDVINRNLKERPKGKWVFDSNFTDFGNPYGTYKCSECGGHSSNKYSFCKDCGADMMKEVENE